jgi:cytoskeletal protein RodZ
LQTVGERLRDEREHKGLTLKDIETVTNIRSLYLQAIEESNYSVLPGEAYVKGFIRNYANALGLNGSEYVELYRKSQQPIEAAPTMAVDENIAQVQEAPSVSPSVSTRRRQRSRKAEIIWLGVLLLVVVLGGGSWWYWSAAQDEPQPQTQLQTQTQQQQQPASSGSAQQQPPAQVAPVKPAGKPVVIAVRFVNQSWIQVIADGKQIYEGIPQTGESMTWQAEQQITMKVGNAGAVELTHNGQSIGKLGGNGEVVLKTFTANGRQ